MENQHGSGSKTGRKKVTLSSIKLTGYKSFDNSSHEIHIRDITVLLGANGSGKSNVVSLFHMLNYMMTGALQTYIAQNGSAESFLYYGAKKTTRFTIKLNFSNNEEVDDYEFTLAHAAGDILIFTKESLSYHNKLKHSEPYLFALDPGAKESGLFSSTKDPGAKTNKIIYSILRKCQYYQFHDTSKESRIRNKGYIHQNEYLMKDGGNLAAFLYALQNKKDGDKY
ncbi:MAG: AAA family ATPase, partial [Bacteroidota bacterium]